MKNLFKKWIDLQVGKYSVESTARIFSLFVLFTLPSISVVKADDPVDGTWKSGAGAGSWSDSGKWVSGDIPGGAGAVVNLNTGTGGGVWITIGDDVNARTVGVINFGGTSYWTLAGTGVETLTFDNGGSAAEINVSALQSVGSPNVIHSNLASTILNSDLVITNDSLVTVLTYSAKITETGGSRKITKNGEGTLSIGNTANDYSGGFVLNNGFVQPTTANAFGTGTLTLNGGGIKASGGYVTIANHVEIGGDVNLATGSDNGMRAYTGSVTLLGSHVLTVDKQSTISGVISDGGNGYSITKDGEGTLSLGQDNTYSGGFILKEGIVNLTADAAIQQQFGTGILVLEGGAISSDRARTIGNDVRVDGNATINASASAQIYYVGSWTLTGNRVLTNNVSTRLGVDKDGKLVDAATFGESGGSYSLTKEGAALLLIGKTSYTGGTIVNGGTLSLEAGTNLLYANGAVTINEGGTLHLSNKSQAVGQVTLAGGNITASNDLGKFVSSVGFNVQAGSSTGVFDGTGGLTKTTSGTVTLNSRTHTYTGATSIQAGTLIIAGGSINATSGISITGGKLRYDSTTGLNRDVEINGGTLAYNGTNPYTGTLTFTSGVLAGTHWEGSLSNLEIGENQAISPGNSPGEAVTVNQTWAGGGSYIWEMNDATGSAGTDPGWDLVSGSGDLTITANTSNKFTIQIVSLKLDNTAGDAVNFDGESDYQWKIADFTNTIALDLTAFQIDDSAFLNNHSGSFGLGLGGDLGVGDNTQVWLTYASIPEASTTLLIAFAGLIFVVFYRRKSRRALG